MRIQFTRGDLCGMAVDALVNPTNSLGIMGTGLSRRMRRSGGISLQREAMAHAPIAIGAAVVTLGGLLPAARVIHAPVVSEPGQPIDGENVRRAVTAALIAAERHGLLTIAIPVVDMEPGGVTFEAVGRVLIHALLAHHGAAPQVVHIVDSDQSVLDQVEDTLTGLSARWADDVGPAI